MHTSRCALCGSWAENPVTLSWMISGGPEETEDETWAGSLPLCSSCSNSWCPELAPRPAACPGSHAM